MKQPKCDIETWEKVQRLIADGVDLTPQEVTPNLVITDYFTDDWDFCELACQISYDFDIDMPTEVVEQVADRRGTIGQLAETIQAILDSEGDDDSED